MPGTLIEAFLGDQVCGQTPGGSYFELLVRGAGEQEGCAGPGDMVRFRIDGHEAAETLTWPEDPFGFDILSLTAVDEQAWYWFERVSSPRPDVGMMVQAYIGGVMCAETTIGGEDEANGYFIPEGIRGFSRMVVSSAAGAACGQNGALVEFAVNGLRAETAVPWRPGVQRLDLVVQGDANCDFLVDARDALLALQVTAALIDDVPCHGDADRDRDIDVFDARHILEFDAGITNALPL
jgi:hypothetical protein